MAPSAPSRGPITLSACHVRSRRRASRVCGRPAFGTPLGSAPRASLPPQASEAMPSRVDAVVVSSPPSVARSRPATTGRGRLGSSTSTRRASARTCCTAIRWRAPVASSPEIAARSASADARRSSRTAAAAAASAPASSLVAAVAAAPGIGKRGLAAVDNRGGDPRSRPSLGEQARRRRARVEVDVVQRGDLRLELVDLVCGDRARAARRLLAKEKQGVQPLTQRDASGGDAAHHRGAPRPGAPRTVAWRRGQQRSRTRRQRSTAAALDSAGSLLAAPRRARRALAAATSSARAQRLRRR